ncbi:DUF1176 domain-containing protein [Sphingobium yanoikuyae]|uniref:DUF1176 domain-containing protein n=1 Tax=Sphingobium yanoikuyae TaxID=13690 RepID=UPI00345E2781
MPRVPPTSASWSTAAGRDGDRARCDATLRGPQASALAIAMARGSTMEVRTGNRSLGRPRLAGAGAAIRYMDARQGRAGTTTALVATGPLGPLAVRVAPPTPAIHRAIIAAGDARPPLWREERTALGKFHRLHGRDGPMAIPNCIACQRMTR